MVWVDSSDQEWQKTFWGFVGLHPGTLIGRHSSVVVCTYITFGIFGWPAAHPPATQIEGDPPVRSRREVVNIKEFK